MDSNTIVSLVAGLVILALIILAVWIRYKTHPSATDKDAAKKFLEGLEDTFYKKMLDIIKNIDFSKYDSLTSLEANILCDIYDTIWDYVEEKTKDLANEDIITALVLKVLDKQYVHEFVDVLIAKYNISALLEQAWNENAANNISEAEKEDKVLQAKFKNQKEYIEKVSEKDLPPVEHTVPTEEELSKLNPPRDEEEAYDPNDESMEIVDEDTYIDEKGRKRNKTTGRFTK